MTNIKVGIKFRPKLPSEEDEDLQWILSNKRINSINGRYQLGFGENVFNAAASSVKLYDKLAKSIVLKTLEGYNGTIMAYGQTSSGKTFNMIGTEEMPGVIPMAVRDIFKRIFKNRLRKFNLKIGYIEIYNDKVYDLLDGRRSKLKVYDSHGTPYINQVEYIVESEKEVFEHLEEGNKCKRMIETSTNDRSSRSHTVFRITIESDDGYDAKHSSLYLVDLAGSEKPDVAKSTFNEGLHINKSLLVLGKIIRELAKKKSDLANVNFRECKLTRILSEALGGNSLTAIICTVSPVALEETYHTICFAQNARKAKTNPTFNMAPRVSLSIRQDTPGNSSINSGSRRRKITTPGNSDLDLSRPKKKVRKVEVKSRYRQSMSSTCTVVAAARLTRNRHSRCFERIEESQIMSASAYEEQEHMELSEDVDEIIGDITTMDETITDLENTLEMTRHQLYKSQHKFEQQIRAKDDAIDTLVAKHGKEMNEAQEKIASLEKDIEIYGKTIFENQITMKMYESRMLKAQKEAGRKYNQKLEDVIKQNEAQILDLQEKLSIEKIGSKVNDSDEIKFLKRLERMMSGQMAESLSNLEITHKALVAGYREQSSDVEESHAVELARRDQEIAALTAEIESLKMADNSSSPVRSRTRVPKLVSLLELQSLAASVSRSIQDLNRITTKNTQAFINQLTSVFYEIRDTVKRIEGSIHEDAASSIEVSEPPSTAKTSESGFAVTSESGFESCLDFMKTEACPYCAKPFLRKATLANHILVTHDHLQTIIPYSMEKER